jgi:hypothetical protein
MHYELSPTRVEAMEGNEELKGQLEERLMGFCR